MIYVHKEGKVAEYALHNETVKSYKRVGGSDSPCLFGSMMYIEGDEYNAYTAPNEALQAAIDYHETEGCALYLELYPAPEKGEYGFIAQDADGEWCGYNRKPDLKEDAWVERTSLDWHHICKSPPNPFWRKTLR